jgi:hypothetical protein
MDKQQRKWYRPLSAFVVAVVVVGSLLFAATAWQTAAHSPHVVAEICTGAPGPCPGASLQ